MPRSNSSSPNTVFTVLEGGTLVEVGCFEPQTRSEDLGIDPKSIRTAADLLEAASESSEIQQLLEDERANHATETEGDLASWLNSLAKGEVRRIAKGIRDWLKTVEEEETDPDEGPPGQRAALEFFRFWEKRDLRALGVQVTEGSHPGSSYCAAELITDPASANATAKERGWEIRFRKGR